MTTGDHPRRILIVDDQQAIHDSFDRIFAARRCEDAALFDFEQRFLRPAGDRTCDAPPPASGQPQIQYQLEHAASGEQAVRYVQQAIDDQIPYAVAFVDMRMPCGMDGMETTEQLWQIDPDLQVVICTAYSDHVWEDVLRRLGYTDRLLLLKKPFESDEARQLALALSEKSKLIQIQRRKVLDLGHEVERRRNAEQMMREMAHRDPLTSLPNRPYLLEKLSDLIGNRQPSAVPSDAVLFLDLDNFKIINDSLGHDAGDDLLNQVAARLQQCVRDQDTAQRLPQEDGETVRLGGDEFVVLLEHLCDPQDALVVAQRIVQRISEPFPLNGRPVTIGTSVGVAFIDDRVADSHQVLQNADTAMYRAKNRGKGQIAVFDQTMHDEVVARMELENQLRRTIQQQGFQLHYQPIIDLKRATVKGVEVLMRWHSDDGRWVSPSEFIPMIEDIGLIGQVGEWVLQQSMCDFAAMIQQLPDDCGRDVYLGVNLSCRQLGDPFFQSRLDAILDLTGFDRSLLKLEMNETRDPRQSEQALQTMLELYNSGIGIQIDDFGKGQSSLTCFQSYPIEAVKIDRSFTASIATDHGHAVIAQAMVQLAHHLNAKIVAEGVESRAQLEVLRAWGCDAVQGYLISPPLTIDQLGQLLIDPSRSEGIRMLRSEVAPTFKLDSERIQPIQLS